MKEILDIKVLPNYKLECLFNDGSKKIADLSPLLHSEVFKPLINAEIFSSKIINHGYFIEWSGHDIDLSADTIWHLSTDAPITPETLPS